MKERSFWVNIATLGPIGYTIAPGTIATLLMLPFVYWLRIRLCNEWHYALLVISGAIFAFICIEHALNYFSRQRDPSAIVLDECLGTFITFYAIPSRLPLFIVGFILFRIIDIAKPLGLRKVEMLRGALGVMVDDIVAGMLTNILLHFCYYYISFWFKY